MGTLTCVSLLVDPHSPLCSFPPLCWEDRCSPIQSLFSVSRTTIHPVFWLPIQVWRTTVHPCVFSSPSMLGGPPYIHVLRLSPLELSLTLLFLLYSTSHPVCSSFITCPESNHFSYANHCQVNPSHQHLLWASAWMLYVYLLIPLKRSSHICHGYSFLFFMVLFRLYLLREAFLSPVLSLS